MEPTYHQCTSCILCSNVVFRSATCNSTPDTRRGIPLWQGDPIVRRPTTSHVPTDRTTLCAWSVVLRAMVNCFMLFNRFCSAHVINSLSVAIPDDGIPSTNRQWPFSIYILIPLKRDTVSCSVTRRQPIKKRVTLNGGCLPRYINCKNRIRVAP